MSTDSYTLPFLENLGESFTDHDVEALWQNRHFPLVRTADFSQNWTVVMDDDGLFVTPSGANCRVEPQEQYRAQCNITIKSDGTSREETFGYEVIIFGNVVHRLWESRCVTEKTTACMQVQRQRFIQQFVRKLPKDWRNAITYREDILGREDISKAHATNKGIHHPLSKPQNIRLISLQPSTTSYAPIECTMFEADLLDRPEYEALSYVWGPPDTTYPIEINGSRFLVTKNLEAALRQFRPHGTTPRILWIDAICINQSDVKERTQQVQQMDAVYRGAECVLVWVGPESTSSGRLFDHFDQASELARKSQVFLGSPDMFRFPFEPEPYCASCDGNPPTLSREQIEALGMGERETEALMAFQNQPRPQEHVSKAILIELLEDMVEFFQRTWWRRMWVLQEVILAKKVFVQCGSRSVRWDILQFVMFTYIRQAKRARLYHLGSLSHDSRRGRAQTMLLVLAKGAFPFFFLQKNSPLGEEVGDLDMVNLLSLSWGFDATDDRDKIFALVGLLQENSSDRLTFTPDYSINKRQLFIQTAKHFLQSSQSLAVITARQDTPPSSLVKSRRGDINALPTWVPDWGNAPSWLLSSIWVSEFSEFYTLNLYMPKSRQGRHHHQSSHEHGVVASEASHEAPVIRIQVYNASLFQKSPFPVEFTGWDEIAHVHGITVDTLSEVGRPLDLPLTAINHHKPGNPGESKLGAANAQMEIVHEWKSMARTHDLGDYPFAIGQTRLEAFWRTVFLDRYRQILPNGATTISRFPSPLQVETGAEEQEFDFQVTKCMFPPKTSDEEDDIMWYLRHEAIEMWSFASLNLHSAQLCFFRTEKGYIGVCHPNARPGDQVVVLPGSPVPLVMREYPEGHVLVGQSYVHGIMDGEIMLAEQKNGKGMKSEDFETFALL